MSQDFPADSMPINGNISAMCRFLDLHPQFFDDVLRMHPKLEGVDKGGLLSFVTNVTFGVEAALKEMPEIAGNLEGLRLWVVHTAPNQVGYSPHAHAIYFTDETVAALCSEGAGQRYFRQPDGSSVRAPEVTVLTAMEGAVKAGLMNTPEYGDLRTASIAAERRGEPLPHDYDLELAAFQQQTSDVVRNYRARKG